MRILVLMTLLTMLASPLQAVEHVTVEQLAKIIPDLHGEPDKKAAQRLGELELTERLSAARLESLKTELQGAKTQMALLALADASAFLDLPAADLLQIPKPDSTTQGQMMSRATDFVIATVSKMPDFFATRTTTRFQDLRVSQLADQTVVAPNQSFQLLDRQEATVTFRNGQEVVEAPGKQRSDATVSTGLTSWGTFGPLLRVAMTDILRGKLGWGHWERGPTGPLAVFRYVVAKNQSNYKVRYCCFRSAPEGYAEPGEMHEFETVSAYHGELAIDPVNGAVFRLVLKTDLEPSLAMGRADVVVEYGPVEMGGRTYICPLKSTSISKAEAMVTHESNFYVGKRGNGGIWLSNETIPGQSAGEPKVTAINDVAFTNYHQFRAEMRILPAEDPASDGNLPAAAPEAPATKKKP